jgi:hypothetical protein
MDSMEEQHPLLGLDRDEGRLLVEQFADALRAEVVRIAQADEHVAADLSPVGEDELACRRAF